MTDKEITKRAEVAKKAEALLAKLPEQYHIAISSQSGCGNTTVSTLLAELLHMPIVNYTFRNLAVDRGIPFDEIRRMALVDDEIDRYVDAHQVELALESPRSILASRLAVWMLKDADVRIYLSASAEVRGGRVHNREGGSLEDRIEETEDRDAQDSKRYKYLYNIDNKDTSMCDLVVSAEVRTPIEIVERILDYIEEQLCQ